MPLKRLKSLPGPHFAGLLPPAAIGLSSALLELGGGPLRTALRYDRDGLEAGEFWRLLTGHLVHLGPSHMVMNVLALAVLAVVLEPMLRPRDWFVVGLAAALAIDAGLYWCHPSVEWYVGLSGVLHGFWSAACVRGLLSRRGEAVPLTLLLLGKLAYERLAGPIPLTGEIAAGPVVTQAHAWGAAGGALAALALLAIRRRRSPL
jgi:rhomboid family GlyGly-CTERM serine protease